MDDKTEGIIVEEGGGVGEQKPVWAASRDGTSNAVHGGEEDESEKGDDEDPYATVGQWDEIYEQEV